jgi:hypothetical protein
MRIRMDEREGELEMVIEGGGSWSMVDGMNGSGSRCCGRGSMEEEVGVMGGSWR